VRDFIKDWPPPPYPFDVDSDKAARGMVHYEKYCQKCHNKEFDNSKIYPEVATDDSRLKFFSEESKAGVVSIMKRACPKNSVIVRGLKVERPCEEHENDIFRMQTTDASRGFTAPNHFGLWARAPYLHNGSVPTLYHLLVPRARPDTFVRGSLDYDKEKVGFAWEPEKLTEFRKTDKLARLQDTRLETLSNKGHDKNLGLDWGDKSNQERLGELLEYLKTL
jgi:hypothetical protein